MAAEHLVVVGKSGAGKSTTAANLSAALAESGKRVLLVGYDSHWSSTGTLRGGNQLRALPGWGGEGDAPRYAAGFRDSLCIEAGGDAAAEDTDGGEILANPLVSDFDPQYVVHDSTWKLGRAFSLPSGVDGVPRLLAVTSGDKWALLALNHLFAWLNTVSAANCRFGGVVVNNLSGPLYEAIVSDFASHTGTTIAASVPHSIMISVSDYYSQTLLESAPFSHVSYTYRKLGRSVVDGGEPRRPKPLDADAFKRWAQKWGDIISELETGVVTDGLGI